MLTKLAELAKKGREHLEKKASPLDSITKLLAQAYIPASSKMIGGGVVGGLAGGLGAGATEAMAPSEDSKGILKAMLRGGAIGAGVGAAGMGLKSLSHKNLLKGMEKGNPLFTTRLNAMAAQGDAEVALPNILGDLMVGGSGVAGILGRN